jgi:hypothetical protein
MLIEIEYRHPIDCKLHVDDKLVDETFNSLVHKFKVDSLECNIKIFITPYKIQPIIRIDNILVNYGLAKITPWDHMLELNYTNDFFRKYRKSIVKYKMEHYDLTSIDEQEYDFYIGIGNDHTSLVRDIYTILDSKE